MRVFPRVLRQGAPDVGASQFQPDREGVLDVHPDKRDYLLVGKGDGVLDLIPDERLRLGQAPAVAHFLKGVAVPELGQQPDDDDEGANDDEQSLAGEQTDDDQNGTDQQPKIVEHSVPLD